MGEERPIPRIECETCSTFWTRSNKPKGNEVVPVAVRHSPKKQKGLVMGEVLALPEYRHLPCYEENKAHGKILNFFLDEYGRRIPV